MLAAGAAVATFTALELLAANTTRFVWPSRIPATPLLAPATVPSPESRPALSLPCDILAAGRTPCVAAHSTTRALRGSYRGPLYRVRRDSDSTTTDVGLLATADYADAAVQDSFCEETTCIITAIYDQSIYHNDLTIEQAGGAGAADTGVPADALPVTAGGHVVYGASFSGGMGYRNNTTNGVATGSQPEGMYMVTSGTHYNNRCCFDYGNTEATNFATGNGHMDAINFGNECWFPPCHGDGPWVQADLEGGLFQSDRGYSTNTFNTGNRSPYVTAMLKNNGKDFFAIKDGNARSGTLTTRYAGALPTRAPGYSPMHKEGGIVLGTGGDNSNGSIGSFFEGVMTSGMPSDAADNAVQANVVGVGYGGPSPVRAGSLQPGSTVSVRAATPGRAERYLRHRNGAAVTSVINPSSTTADKDGSSWIVRRGLADTNCVSFESRDYPGDFLRHSDFRLIRQPMDGTERFRADATFCPQTGQNGIGTSFASHNYPKKSLRRYNGAVYLAGKGGPSAWDSAVSWAGDVSWTVTPPWTP